MWIGRHDLTDRPTRRKLMWGGAMVALSGHWLSIILAGVAASGALPLDTMNYIGAGWSPEPLYSLTAAGTATFLITVAQEAVTARPDSKVLRALIHTGQLSLSVYVTHALLGVKLWTWQTDWFDDMAHWGVVLYSFGFCTIVILLVTLYRRKLQRGPLEWIMRGLTGSTPRKTQPMRLHRLAEPPAWGAYGATAAFVLLTAFQFTGMRGPGCADPIDLGERNFASLSLTCAEQPFRLTLDQAQEVTLRTWSGVDLYMEVYQDGELVAENDDYEGDLDPRVWSRLEPGEYEVIIRPYSSAIGAFVFTTELAEAQEIEAGFLCTNTCRYAGDGDCDDGGPEHDYYLCDYGTDCEDCGPRDESLAPAPPEPGTEICTDECPYANDGDCDDGGPDSDYAVCRFGSDCGDCGVRIAPELEGD